MLDLLIKNARVADGTGNPWYPADIWIQDGKIVDLRESGSCEAAQIIDAGRQVVCPGFIDVHTHNDIMLTYDTACLSKLMQGVTTQIVGNCGFSAAPLNDATAALLQAYAEPSLGKWAERVPWHSFGEYLSRLETLPLAGHVGALVGSGTVRMAVKGFARSPMSRAELEQAKAYITEALDSGAMGYSMGLTYTPDNYYTTDELTEIAALLARRGAVMAVHMRGEGDSLLRSIGELLTIAQRTGVRTQISHFKAAGKNNWNGRIREAMELIEQGRAEGLDITCDMYPYTACFSQFPFLMPPWALEGGIEAALERVRRPETRARIRAEMESRQESWDSTIYSTGWENVVIASTVNPAHKELEGLTVAEIARRQGKQETECGLDLFLENEGRLGFIFFFVSEEDIRTILKWDHAFIASDSTYVNDGVCHPRMFGTNVRILRKYVREEKVLPLEQAVRKMTAFPAARFSLKGKGLLLPGYDADLVIFDPETIRDRASYQEPKQYPDGISHVIVGGREAVRDGKYIGVCGGNVLRRGRMQQHHPGRR